MVLKSENKNKPLKLEKTRKKQGAFFENPVSDLRSTSVCDLRIHVLVIIHAREQRYGNETSQFGEVCLQKAEQRTHQSIRREV